MRWFRFYDEVLDDPKVQRLPPALFYNLMISARKPVLGRAGRR